MALCVALAADGTLVPTGQAVTECAGYVLVSASEYGVYEVVQQALAMPTPEEAMKWFTACAGAVVVWFIVGRMAGAVVSVFKT
ncbi:hypothetical protein [Stenotrophomonas sp.]|uniref:hypothetical protein n=1 Tax=Stenotrophomonas sp. TaxID=69392 RepID=UPI0028B11513|nr:hypothetical protein [Stenotrophomonas sp.]